MDVHVNLVSSLAKQVVYNPLQTADLKAPIDKRVINKVNALVDEGISNVSEMTRHMRLYVKSLFGQKALPNFTNRRYYPTREDLRKLMYRRRQKNMEGLLDQENLQKLISVWQTERPSDLWFYRPSVTEYHERNEDGIDENPKRLAQEDKQSLLIVYQSAWQQRLLKRYGNEMVFLDATYRTTCYDVPLFFLCVHTNVGYSIVATLVMENENSASLSEALLKLHEMNPEWYPKAFMVDYSEIEIKAIGMNFPGM